MKTKINVINFNQYEKPKINLKELEKSLDKKMDKE